MLANKGMCFAMGYEIIHWDGYANHVLYSRIGFIIEF